MTYEEFSLMIGGKHYDDVTVKCQTENCCHYVTLLRCSTLQNFRKNGKFICMSCAQNGCWNYQINNEESNIILGSLLGDASIVKGRTKQFNTAIISIEHSIKQSDYVNWKYEKLKNIATSSPKIKLNQGHGDLNVKFDSKCHSCFYYFYEISIKNNIKTISNNWLKAITKPIALAVWYMDDGYLDNSNGQCRISTEAFTYNEQMILSRWLKYKFNIESTIHKHKQYYRLSILAKSRETFFNLIKEHIPDCMKYKIVRIH